MITRNEYVKYITLNSRAVVFDWIRKKQCFSNNPNYQKHIVNLLDYKDKAKYSYTGKNGKKVYKALYAHTFKIMLPKDFNKQQKHEFANKFIISFDARFKKNIYLYRFVEDGNGTYVEYLMFTRYAYKKKIKKNVVYKDDYYQNSITKKRCKADDPHAVKKHSKGDLILDVDGNPLKEDVRVAKKEDKIFKFTSFSRFIDSIKKIITATKMLFTRNLKNNYKKLSLITIEKEDSILIRQKKIIRNQGIMRINSHLREIQDAIYFGYMDDKKTVKSFNNLVYRINNSLYRTNKSIGGINVYLGLKQSFASYRCNLIELENKIEEWIERFLDKNINEYARGFLYSKIQFKA